MGDRELACGEADFLPADDASPVGLAG